MREFLELEFERKRNYQIYWDDIAMFCYFKEYELGIWPMKARDVIELAAVTSYYRKNEKNGYESMA